MFLCLCFSLCSSLLIMNLFLLIMLLSFILFSLSSLPCVLSFFLSGGAAASGTLSATVWWGGRRWRAGGRPGLRRVQPCWWPLRGLRFYLCPGVPGERDRPSGHRLHHPQRGQGRPRLCVSPTDGEAGDVLRPAGLPPGQVHHCGPWPADSWGDVPVCAAHGVHLPGRDVPSQGGICSTQEDLWLYQPEDEAAGNWRGSRRRGGWGWRWGVFGGTRKDEE